jgi:hypothetical protein
MTDDEKREILAVARATVERGRSQSRSLDDDHVSANHQKGKNQGANPGAATRYSDPIATRPKQVGTAQAAYLDPPPDGLFTDRERALLEAVAEEFCERDEKIEDLKCEVAELRRLSDAQLRNHFEPLFQEFYRKLDATILRADELMRSINRHEPTDLPPLPMTRRVN